MDSLDHGASPENAEPDPEVLIAAPERLWTREFVQVCAGGFLSYASQSPVTPLIALYVVHLGGSVALVGLVTAAFSAPSFLLRPVLGRLCDTWSARGVFAIGCIVSGLGSMLILVPFLPMVLVSQVLNGAGWAGLNTGGYTMLAQIAPPSRRGAASSYQQIFRVSLGFYLPYVALKLKTWVGFWLPFLLTSVAGLLATFTAIGIKEPPRLVRADESEVSLGWFDRFIDRDVVFPSTLNFMTTVTGPAVNTFIVLYAKHLGIGEGRIAEMFLASGAFTIVTQILLASLADRVGRSRAILFGLVTTTGSMLLLSQAGDFWLLIAGMMLANLGSSMTPPAIQAMAIDRSKPDRRGVAMGTFTLSFQFGAFVGGLAGGYLIVLCGYQAFYALAAIPPVLALLVLAARWRYVMDGARSQPAQAVR